MKKIAVIGVGLIGGSLGMALKRHRGSYHITGLGRDKGKLKLAKRLGAVDEWSLDWNSGVSDADIIVVCTPVDLIAATIKKILPSLKCGAIITDVGSVKGSVVKEVKKVLSSLAPKPYPLAPVFIGGHPLAGLEKTGVQSASYGLYKNATVVLTPEPGSSRPALAALKKMWEDTGANTVIMTPARHDRIVAVTSHLSHALAFSLCLDVSALSRLDPEASGLLAGSFRDMTRIADSNPRDWAAICSGNRKEVEKAIDRYILRLKYIKKTLSSPRRLEKQFASAKEARIKLLKEGKR